MPRFTLDNAQEFTNTSFGYFTLADHGDTARVRILAKTGAGIIGCWTHKLEVGGRERQIECLAKNRSTARGDCPLCAAGYKQKYKIFIPVLNIETDEYQIWERGSDIIQELKEKVLPNENIVSRVFEISRNGGKGDRDTKYGIEDSTNFGDYDTDVGIEEFEVPAVFVEGDSNEGIVLVKSYEELEYYASNGMFKEDTLRPRSTEASEGGYYARRREEKEKDGGEETGGTETRRRRF